MRNVERFARTLAATALPIAVAVGCYPSTEINQPSQIELTQKIETPTTTVEQTPQISQLLIPPDKPIGISNLEKSTTSSTGISEIQIYQESASGMTYVGLKPDLNYSGVTMPMAQSNGLVFQPGGFIPFNPEFDIEESQLIANDLDEAQKNLTSDISIERALEVLTLMFPKGDYRGTIMVIFPTPELYQDQMYLISSNLTISENGEFSESALLKIKLKFVGPPPQI